MKMALGFKQEPLFFSTDSEASAMYNKIGVNNNTLFLTGGDLVRERIAYLERDQNYKFSLEPGETITTVYPGQVTITHDTLANSLVQSVSMTCK